MPSRTTPLAALDRPWTLRLAGGWFGGGGAVILLVAAVIHLTIGTPRLLGIPLGDPRDSVTINELGRFVIANALAVTGMCMLALAPWLLRGKAWARWTALAVCGAVTGITLATLAWQAILLAIPWVITAWLLLRPETAGYVATCG